jgi:hypothetical protein
MNLDRTIVTGITELAYTSVRSWIHGRGNIRALQRVHTRRWLGGALRVLEHIDCGGSFEVRSIRSTNGEIDSPDTGGCGEREVEHASGVVTRTPCEFSHIDLCTSGRRHVQGEFPFNRHRVRVHNDSCNASVHQLEQSGARQQGQIRVIHGDTREQHLGTRVQGDRG